VGYYAFQNVVVMSAPGGIEPGSMICGSQTWRHVDCPCLECSELTQPRIDGRLRGRSDDILLSALIIRRIDSAAEELMLETSTVSLVNRNTLTK